MNIRPLIFAVVTVVTVLAMTNVSAQTVQLAQNGTLIDSTYTSTTVNDLTPGSGTNGYNFSGATGSFSNPAAGGAFSSPSAASANGYYYADYLFNVSGSTVESVTTSLDNMSGVNNLSERIYTYNAAAGENGFLGDASLSSAGVSGIQLWSTNYPLPGAEVSIISPSDITSGSYVIELRGTSLGNFAGTFSITPVPEPDTYILLLVGLILIGLIAYRRMNEASAKLLAE